MQENNAKRHPSRNGTRVVVALIVLGVVVGGGFTTGVAEASCEENFEECEGSLDPLEESIAAISLFAWIVLRLLGVILLLAGALIYVTPRTNVQQHKKWGLRVMVAGAALLLFYFAADAIMGLINYIIPD